MYLEGFGGISGYSVQFRALVYLLSFFGSHRWILAVTVGCSSSE